MRATIVSIGDELASGLTVNTNASWLAAQLMGVGILTGRHVTVPDQMEAIVAAIKEAMAESDLVLISGGLGPTEDDLTRQGLALALGDELVEDAGAMGQLKAWFAKRGRAISGSNFVQAMRPRTAECIENFAGTAPGLVWRGEGKRLFVMPGVPKEMREMFARSIMPELAGGGLVTLTRKLHTFGVGESVIGERIGDLMARGGVPGHEGATVGTTVHEGIVSVRIYATGERGRAEELVARVGEILRARLGVLIFGEEEETLESAVGGLLAKGGKTVATAESCTGGLIAEMLTEVAGSSAYFLRGYVTYANAAKSEDLGVEAALIEKHGAVSEEVARAMAEGVRRRAGADFGVATTGIAGPGGGSAEKPVGTVWMAVAGAGGTMATRQVFAGERRAVRMRAAQMVLTLLRLELLGLKAAEVLR